MCPRHVLANLMQHKFKQGGHSWNAVREPIHGLQKIPPVLSNDESFRSRWRLIQITRNARKQPAKHNIHLAQILFVHPFFWAAPKQATGVTTALKYLKRSRMAIILFTKYGLFALVFFTSLSCPFPKGTLLGRCQDWCFSKLQV